MGSAAPHLQLLEHLPASDLQASAYSSQELHGVQALILSTSSARAQQSHNVSCMARAARKGPLTHVLMCHTAVLDMLWVQVRLAIGVVIHETLYLCE